MVSLSLGMVQKTMNIDKDEELIEFDYLFFEEMRVSSLNDVLMKIFRMIDDATKWRNSFQHQQRCVDAKIKVLSKISEKLGKKMGITSLGRLLSEETYLETQYSTVDSYLYQLTVALRVANEDNYSEVNKIVEYAREKYLRDRDTVEGLRQGDMTCDEQFVSNNDFSKEFYLTKQFIDGKLENLILNSIDKKTSRVKSKADDKK